jgi:hypothetical protein
MATKAGNNEATKGNLLGRLVAAGADEPWSNPLVLLLIAGVGGLGMLAWSRDDRFQSIAAAILVAGAALAAGAILGFLFGIPRALQNTTSEEAPGVSGSIYQVNTNLEQISDWLTKIIVGVGLVHLGAIQAHFASLAQSAASAFGGPSIPPALAAAVIIYFAILGFLGSYLWTRLLLTLEFTRADRAARQSPEFYEGLVQALLYQPAPEGFEGAIRNGEDFLHRYGQGNWRIWRALACAYGQKYSYLRLQSSPDSERLSDARDKALEAVKRVLFLNPDEREGIRALWDPNRATPQEDDLTVFAEDEGFRSILQNGA